MFNSKAYERYLFVSYCRKTNFKLFNYLEMSVCKTNFNFFVIKYHFIVEWFLFNLHNMSGITFSNITS